LTPACYLRLLFAGAHEGPGGAGAGAVDAVDALDSSRVAVPPEILAAWQDEGAAERLRNRFVTGEDECGDGQ